MRSTVTAAAVSKNFGTYQDAALREPVIITKNGRPRTGSSPKRTICGCRAATVASRRRRI